MGPYGSIQGHVDTALTMKCLVTSEGKSRLDEHLRKVVCHHGIDDSLYEEEYTITVSEGRRVFCLFTPVTMV